MSTRRVPAFRIVTDIEVSATAVERWQHQYDRWTSDRRFQGGKTKGEVEAELEVCERTPSAITKILNASWANPRCDLCEENASVVAQVGGEYGAKPISCCLTCAERIFVLLSQFPRSAEAVGEPAHSFPAGELP